ncbi:MAG: EAL domain-containing protein, partial [bacterium]|nr:EAL domain-containing protein [bacterium]
MNAAIKTLLARQAIYDKQGLVYAYELLYRNSDDTDSKNDELSTESGDVTTSSVIMQLFSNLDIEHIVGDKKAFINFTHSNIIHQIPHLLPHNKIVIEVLETVTVDQELIASLTKLNQQGYAIALDDFVYREELIPLIQLAHFIKIDVLHLNDIQVREQLIHLKGLFNGFLLAEKIETKGQFQQCQALGFNYFQGFFFDKPEQVQGWTISEDKKQLIVLLAELNNEQVTFEQVEHIIVQIPNLSERILRLTNSVSLYNGKRMNSLMDALRQLGLLPVRNWIILLLLSGLHDVAPDLLTRTLIRAKMCESIAKATGYANIHLAYLVGILSTMDGILNQPMSCLLAQIKLNAV